MIHFYDNIVAKTLETIKEAHDCADILCDLSQIDQAKTNVNLYGDVSTAHQLDRELREKYPCIDAMINFANTMLPQVPQSKKTYSPGEAAVSNLIQDYYGILCDTAVKKGIVREMKQFIKFVD